MGTIRAKNEDCNLCNTCNQTLPDCDAEIVFGNGIGEDNVIECNQYDTKDGYSEEVYEIE